MQLCSASMTTPTPAGSRLSCSQPFLHLRAGGKVPDDAGQLGQPEDPFARQIPDVRDAGEREQVVLAHRAHRDRAGQHELVVVLVVGERREVELGGREQLRVGAGHPGRSLLQALTVGGDAKRPKERAGGLLCRLEIDLRGRRGHPKCAWDRLRIGAQGGRRHSGPPRT
jgi:hypothetical protein